jgi:ribose transport system substrate-binding protein
MVAALEAFEEAGKPYPTITDEGQQDFLKKWKDKHRAAIAPTYPTFPWRTPIIAAVEIPEGRAGRPRRTGNCRSRHHAGRPRRICR